MLTNILTDILPAYAITYDILLISVFGGIINGFLISLCLMMNATTGGTDFIGIFLSERKGVDSFNVILGFNAILLIVAGLLFWLGRKHCILLFSNMLLRRCFGCFISSIANIRFWW